MGGLSIVLQSSFIWKTVKHILECFMFILSYNFGLVENIGEASSAEAPILRYVCIG